MQKIIKENKVWFISFLLFVIIGGILLLKIETSDTIYYFSERRSVFGDLFFKYFTKVGEEVVYLGLIIGFIFYRIRYSVLIAGVGITVTLVSFGMKNFFLHDRPSVYFSKLRTLDSLNMVEGVQLLTGASSFPSGHTMSGFALFGMLAFILPQKKWFGFFLFLIALFIGISRVYLIQHFFKDIYLGAIMGTLISLGIYWFQSLYPYDENSVLDAYFGIIKGKKIIV